MHVRVSIDDVDAANELMRRLKAVLVEGEKGLVVVMDGEGYIYKSSSVSLGEARLAAKQYYDELANAEGIVI